MESLKKVSPRAINQWLRPSSMKAYSHAGRKGGQGCLTSIVRRRHPDQTMTRTVSSPARALIAAPPASTVALPRQRADVRGHAHNAGPMRDIRAASTEAGEDQVLILLPCNYGNTSRRDQRSQSACRKGNRAHPTSHHTQGRTRVTEPTRQLNIYRNNKLYTNIYLCVHFW